MTASGGYRAFLIRAVDVTFWTALALGLVLALCLALIGGVSGEVSADLSADPLEGAWLILLLPALALLFALVLSPLSWALRGGARALWRGLRKEEGKH